MHRLSLDQRVEVIKSYYQNGRSIENATRELRAAFAPSEAAVKQTVETFQSTFSLLDAPMNDYTQQTTDAVSDNDRDIPESSAQSRSSKEIHPSRAAFRGILLTDLSGHPYQIDLLQDIEAWDHLRRRRFCAWMLKQPLELSSKIIFSDEATFYLGNYVNKYNCSILGKTNPPYVDYGKRKNQQPPNTAKTTVWCGLWAGGIIGPYFFENEATETASVNGKSYRDMLINFLWPKLDELDLDEMWFQQDGTPGHTSRQTINLLRSKFGDRIISRNGAVKWPPRSCDLTPVDYFLWGLLKSKVYANKPKTIKSLQKNIRAEIAAINAELLRKVIDNYDIRMLACKAGRGCHLGEISFI